ncbi:MULTISPECIES: NADPH-dependent FMN reductase [Paenibacillus]|uniref:NADPH-dependent FMN reductase n=1 Tax=Paenibacillus TaxID=44249 RepID=UPI0022B877AF|nr:NADPH-dependent FMN reductase [Paenibacillus caseinilyticus]MCZ8518046.1 NAD(P)H-dependent oxidoreductase [Paenibacillus caseinilyticus]
MKITIVTGSNRTDASSTKLSRYIGKVLEESGAEVTLFDLFERPLPFYSPDITGDDPNLAAFRQALNEADGIVLSTPEYHGSLSGVLKNALDWVGFEQFDGKVTLSVSSAGGAVGVSSLQQLQTIVRNVHGINCPEWISVGGSQRDFAADGEPADSKTQERVLRTVQYYVSMVERFKK